MSTNGIGPQWLQVSSVNLQAFSMAGSFSTDAIACNFEDNPDIQVAWTGTPTGTLSIEISLDPVNLGWQAVPFSGITQPAGASGSDYFSLNQTGAAFIRLTYVASGGTGSISGKIAIKSV